jgi:hypothetical protein
MRLFRNKVLAINDKLACSSDVEAVAHAVLRAETMISPTSVSDTVISRLDRLPGCLTSAILSLTPETVEQTIAGMLGQIGEALEADRITLENFAENPAIPAVVRAWSRPRATTVLQPSLSVPVTVAGRRLCVFSIESGYSGQAWPPAVVDRLRLLAELMALAAQCEAQMRELRRIKSDVAQATSQPIDTFDRSWDPAISRTSSGIVPRCVSPLDVCSK